MFRVEHQPTAYAHARAVAHQFVNPVERPLRVIRANGGCRLDDNRTAPILSGRRGKPKMPVAKACIGAMAVGRLGTLLLSRHEVALDGNGQSLFLGNADRIPTTPAVAHSFNDRRWPVQFDHGRAWR